MSNIRAPIQPATERLLVQMSIIIYAGTRHSHKFLYLYMKNLYMGADMVGRAK